MFGSYTHTKWIQYSTVDYVSSIWGRQSHICGGYDHCACLTGSDVTGSHMTFSPTFFPVFSRTFFPYFFSPYFISRTFFPYFFPYFFPRISLVLFFPYYFPVHFQKSRRLKYNVLKYQLVVFLVHVVIRQFMFLAKYPFKRHP